MIPVSGCVISLNEEDRIRACLESMAFCTELIVVDSGSTDRTRRIAAELGARVYEQEWLGHRRQKQRAVDLASHDWVFSLDCDEVATAALREEIEACLREEPSGTLGYRIPRRNVYLGRPMRHGMFWPDRKLRLFDRRMARWGGVDPHDRVESLGPGAVIDLDGEIVHDSYRSFAEHRRTVKSFAEIAAAALLQDGRRAGPVAPWARGAAALTKALVLKLGFLDGWRGVLAAWMSARYDYRKYQRLRALLRETQR